MSWPHPDTPGRQVTCAVVTVSDTRLPETDTSGQLVQACLGTAGHQIADYRIVRDDPEAIRALLTAFAQRPEIDVLILNGGTGIAPRDTTYDAIAGCLDKMLPGFGELFRSLSYSEIGSRAMASRAVAGVYQSLLVFSLPGSTKAVKLAMESLILPEVVHLVGLIKPRSDQ